MPAMGAEKPNVIVLFVDDLGYGDIGPFGATKQKTPNLDRMAAEGMKLTSFYAAPVCSVSRAQLMTGCYGVRVSVPGVFFPAGAEGLHPNETTVAEHLKQLGYVTQIVGKWHLGDQPEFLPTRQGFDHYLGIPYSNDMQRRAQSTGERVVPLLRDEKVEELLTDEKQSDMVERYTQEAVGFLRKNHDKPFFLYLPHTAVHTPIFPGKAFRGKSANGRFGDWVEEVDWSVGQVMDTVRQLKLEERTLIFFTSDNGPWLIKKSDGGSAGPLRGGKGSTWEGGVRVPTLAWWPGTIQPGTACDAMAGTIDLLPTLVHLAGGSLPAKPVIDGRDISPLLLGKSKESPREAHYYFLGQSLQAVRQGPWKLALMPQAEPHLGASPRPDTQIQPRLYHLGEDLGETKNVAKDHPQVVETLTKLAAAMNADIGGPNPPSRRPAGVVAKPVTLYPTVEEPRNNTSGKPVDPGTLKMGGTIPANAAPQIGGRAFTLSCTVETPLSSTILVAHGGKSLGYALHIKEGKLVFSVRTGPSKVVSVESDFPKGPIKMEASLETDGTIRLKVADREPVLGRTSGPIPRQPQEDFCLGHDNGQPITEYGPVQPFSGTLTGLKITPGK